MTSPRFPDTTVDGARQWKLVVGMEDRALRGLQAHHPLRPKTGITITHPAWEDAEGRGVFVARGADAPACKQRLRLPKRLVVGAHPLQRLRDSPREGVKVDGPHPLVPAPPKRANSKGRRRRAMIAKLGLRLSAVEDDVAAEVREGGAVLELVGELRRLVSSQEASV